MLAQLKSQLNKPVTLMVCLSILCLFAFSSARHQLFHSGAWDLGIFDQAVYLLSQNFIPYSSFLGSIHILGDHGAFVLYPISLLYRIYPDVHWLLLIQAIALSVGAFPIFGLALQMGLRQKQAILVSGIYLVYPLTFNANLFDFHPDVIAVPFLLWAILWARLNRIVPFCLALLVIFSCKAVLSLTVVAMGVWLVRFEHKKLLGAIAIVTGSIWFVFATQVVIPIMGGETAAVTRHIGRYNSLGTSFSEILINLFLKPNLIFGRIFSIDTLIYLILLILPLIWMLIKGWRSLNFAPLISIIPAITMNILADDPQQRYLANQYSLPVVLFLFLVVISSFSGSHTDTNKNERKWNYFLVFWAALAFFTMSRLNLFTGEYLASLDTWQATKEAIEIVKVEKEAYGSILTTHEIAPHLTHRPIVNLAFTDFPIQNLSRYNFILLNTRHPDYMSNPQFAKSLVQKISQMPNFSMMYKRDDVYLFSNNLK
jgi:uncharacterized membrane protein